MLARVIQVTLKGGKKPEAFTILQNELVPFLQKQPGFVAFEVGSNETDPNSTISATYWRDKNDAENAYAAPAYTAILNKIRTLVAADFRPVFYNVELSTMHQISLVKAA